MFAAAEVLGVGLMAATGGGPPRQHRVEIRGMAFRPAALEAAVGDTVLWANGDFLPHTATARGRGGWDTGNLDPGETSRVVLRRAGTFEFLCTLHPSMLGSLRVR